MADPMDREMIYSLLYEEIALYKSSEARLLYIHNELELLVRISALTDAVLYDKLSLPEAKHLIRGFIEALKTPGPEDAPEPEEGSIKF